MIKVSVIVPTYKPKSYLWECLNSLCIQTLDKSLFEVILVLNGCSEPWKTQIEKFISINKDILNVNFIHTDRSGVSNARNIALDVARGEYITCIDDDDYISPSYLERMLDMADSDTIVLARPVAFWDETRIEKEYRITREYERCSIVGRQKAYNAKKFFSGPCMKLIPMSYIQDRRFDVRFKNGEDSLFMFLISDKFKDVDFTPEDAIYYRRVRVDSATTANRSRWDMVKNSIKAIKELTFIYFSNPFSYNFYFYFTRILGSIHSMFRA